MFKGDIFEQMLYLLAKLNNLIYFPYKKISM